MFWKWSSDTKKNRLGKPDEIDSGEDKTSPRTREAKLAQLDKRWVNHIHLLVEAYDEGDRHLCHLCDQETKEEFRRGDSLPCVPDV